MGSVLDDTAGIDCYVIANANSLQVTGLLSILMSDSRLNVHQINAIMVDDQSLEYRNLSESSRAGFRARYGRVLFPGEIGCSLSHNLARASASETSKGAIILEEDAQVTDLDKFVTSAISFLSENWHDSKVLSFYNNEFPGYSRDTVKEKKPWVSYFGAPSSAVAYALTPHAAKQLLVANEPIKYVADWPTSKVKYFVMLGNFVSHPHDPTLSQIGNTALRKSDFSTMQKIQILFFIHYLLNRKIFTGFKNFFNDLWLPRFNNKLNKSMHKYFRRIH
jgi:GR25 family glycosyltransferase involved in LPS biosynthesis